MPKHPERGFIHVVAILLLLAGVVSGLYLVSHPTIFKPKASNNETRIEFVDAQGAPIGSTTSQNVKIKLTYVPPTSTPIPTPMPSPVSSDNPSINTISANPNPCTLSSDGFGHGIGNCLTTISWSAPADTIPGLGVWVRDGTSGVNCSGNEIGIVNPDSGTSYNGTKTNPHITAGGQTFDLCYNGTLLKSVTVTGVVASNVQGVSTVADASVRTLTPEEMAAAVAAHLSNPGAKGGYDANGIAWGVDDYGRPMVGNLSTPSRGGTQPDSNAQAVFNPTTGVWDWRLSDGTLLPGGTQDPRLGVFFPSHFRVANLSISGVASIDVKRALAGASEQVFDQNGKIIDWELTPGPGGKTVYAQFKVNNVWEDPVSASIGLVFPNSQSSSTPTSTTSSAKLFVNADRTEVGVDQEVKVNLYALTSDSANLFNAKLNFPKDLLEVTGIEIPETSAITNRVEQVFDNTAGTISIVAGVPNPGISSTGEGILISTIIMKTKASGSAQITFDSSSQILKNSDNSNILAQRDGVIISIDQNFITRIISNIGSNTSGLGSTVQTQTGTSTGAAASGDINGDNKIDLVDYSMVLSYFGRSDFPSAADLNSDGVVNSFDFISLRQKLIQAGVVSRE